jgi:hypothetical protein
MTRKLTTTVVSLAVGIFVSHSAMAYEPDVTQERDEGLQPAPDHLIPTGRAMPSELPLYYIAKYGRYPSFDKSFEWQLVMQKDGKYLLTSWRLALDRDRETRNHAETMELEVPKSVAAVVYEIWANGILHSRYALSGAGLDGTSYSFSTYLRGVGWPSASTWSPESGPPKVLVDAGEAVLSFARSKTGNAEQLLVTLRTKGKYLNDYYARPAKAANNALASHAAP